MCGLWKVKGILSFRMQLERAGGEMKGACVHYMNGIPASNVAEENLSSICLTWSTADEMDHSAGEKELKLAHVNRGECYKDKLLPSLMRNVHHVKFSPIAHSFHR